MIGCRRFLETAAFGLIAASESGGSLFAQDPRPRARAKAKSKTTTAKAATTKDASTPPPVADEQINRILSQARTDGRRLPGMIGAVIRGEEIAAIGAVGIRKIGSPDPMRVDDVVHLGSDTKAMTATMIGTLVDEGKIRWDSSIREVFPDLAGQIHPGFLPVTLRQILAHRSGLPRDLDWWDLAEGRSVVEQRRALMARALRVAPRDRPGSTYEYSNAGYVLAGLMAEKAGKASWEDLMMRRVFEPLGMASAGFGPPGMRGRSDHAWGHRAFGDVVEAVHEDNPASMGPAGTVHCSVPDWAKFAAMHLRGSYKGISLVKPETLKALHTPAPGEEYVGGWLVGDRSWAGGKTLSHNGSNTFWYCTIWLAPARDFALLVATNAGGPPAEAACEEANKGLIQYVGFNDRNRRR